MPKLSSDNVSISHDLTDDEVVTIITNEFPYWKLICDRPGAEPAIIEHRDIEGSPLGMYCLHVAIRYAGIVGKNVLIRS